MYKDFHFNEEEQSAIFLHQLKVAALFDRYVQHRGFLYLDIRGCFVRDCESNNVDKALSSFCFLRFIKHYLHPLDDKYNEMQEYSTFGSLYNYTPPQEEFGYLANKYSYNTKKNDVSYCFTFFPEGHAIEHNVTENTYRRIELPLFERKLSDENKD
jgi:hypothetical protein